MANNKVFSPLLIMSLIKLLNWFELIIFFFCASTIISLTDKNINGLPSDIFVTTTPVVFFGNFRSETSFLLKSLIEIFKSFTVTYLLSSVSALFSALNSSEDSNLPIKTFFEIGVNVN